MSLLFSFSSLLTNPGPSLVYTILVSCKKTQFLLTTSELVKFFERFRDNYQKKGHEKGWSLGKVVQGPTSEHLRKSNDNFR